MQLGELDRVSQPVFPSSVRFQAAAASVRDELGVQQAVRLHVHVEGGVDRQEPHQSEPDPCPHVELELGDVHQGRGVGTGGGVVVGWRAPRTKYKT